MAFVEGVVAWLLSRVVHSPGITTRHAVTIPALHSGCCNHPDLPSRSEASGHKGRLSAQTRPSPERGVRAALGRKRSQSQVATTGRSQPYVDFAAFAGIGGMNLAGKPWPSTETGPIPPKPIVGSHRFHKADSCQPRYTSAQGRARYQEGRLNRSFVTAISLDQYPETFGKLSSTS